MMDSAEAERNGLIIIVTEGEIIHTGRWFETYHLCIIEELSQVSTVSRTGMVSGAG
jgi:hypothetical protein